MFDQFGERVDEILFPPEYSKMLRRGYQSGVVWRAFEQKSFVSTCALMYSTAFYDSGVVCPRAVSLATKWSMEMHGGLGVL